MSKHDDKLVALTTLVLLQSQARKQETPQDLAFMAVNESFRLAPYRQCVFWQSGPGGAITVSTISGLADPGDPSPYIVWLQGLIRATLSQDPADAMISLTSSALSTNEDRENWAEWCGAEALLIPFRTNENSITAGLWFDRETPFTEGEKNLLNELAESYAYALDRLNRHHKPLAERLRAVFAPTKRRVIAGALVAAVLLFPVRLSVSVPAEVTAKNPFIIASPVNGVIEDILVEANSPVKKGDVLAQIENTALKNQAELAGKALAVAQASYARASREAFRDTDSKAETAFLKADMDAKAAELAYAQALSDLSTIRAPQDGIALFTDKNALRGQPVQAGERIMLLAEPSDTDVTIRIPAERFLEVRKDIKASLFLNINPLAGRTLAIESISYEPGMDADGLLTYKVRAAFADGEEKPGIGLKGTAKVYGDRTILLYKILRRPLAALRRLTGL
jgi:membrane-associated protease RseP (regulator of RpoE activity)